MNTSDHNYPIGLCNALVWQPNLWHMSEEGKEKKWKTRGERLMCNNSRKDNTKWICWNYFYIYNQSVFQIVCSILLVIYFPCFLPCFVPCFIPCPRPRSLYNFPPCFVTPWIPFFPRATLPYVRLPKYENYQKIDKTALTKAPEVSKLRLSNFVHVRRTIWSVPASMFHFDQTTVAWAIYGHY